VTVQAPGAEAPCLDLTPLARAAAMPPMRSLAKAAPLLLATLTALPACSSSYMPRPGPRIAIMQHVGNPVLVKNGRQYNIGFFGDGLIDAVEDNEAALERAESFRTRTITSFAMELGGVLFAIGGTGLVTSEAVNERREVTGAALLGASMAFAGIGLMIAGIFVMSSAPPEFYDAINIYNDSVMPAPVYIPPAGWPAPPPGALVPWAQPPGSAPLR
jgi:hypothetical protein